MTNNDPPKQNISARCWCFVLDHCCDLGAFFQTWFCHSLAKVTGNKCEDRKFLTLLVAMFCLCLMSVGLVNVGFFIKNYFWSSTENTSAESLPEKQVSTQTANVISASTDINIDTPEDDTADLFSKCDLDTGKWVRWFGKINQDFEDKTHFTLPVNSGGALFKYIGKIEDFTSCEFVFIPTSESSVNYVISLDEIYQIVIGDNDFWTVALRATDSIGGDLVPVNEDVTQKTRPRLLNEIKKGTVVRAVLNQGFANDGKYHIELVITYKPDSVEIGETQISKFLLTIDPSPAILEKPSLSIGLIRGSGDKSEIGVKFVDPAVIQEDEAETD